MTPASPESAAGSSRQVTPPSRVSARSIEALERMVDGPVLRPDTLQYEEARRSFNALVDRRPAVIVQPRSAEGVSSAVRVAADADLPVSVRGGGHSVAGHAMADGAIAIDLRRMRKVTTIDDFVKGRMLGGILIESVAGVAREEPKGGSSFGQREASYNVSALATWEDPQEDADRIAWARDYASALAPLSLSGGGYLNYSTEETGDRVRAAFGDEKYSRLEALKSKWDPDNRFRFNHNVAPSGS